MIFFFPFFATMKYSYAHSVACVCLEGAAVALVSSNRGVKSWFVQLLTGDQGTAICPFGLCFLIRTMGTNAPHSTPPRAQ